MVSACWLPARSELPACGVSQQPSAALGEGSEGLMQRRVQAVLQGGWEQADLSCEPGEGVPMEQRWVISGSVLQLPALTSLSRQAVTFALPLSAVESLSCRSPLLQTCCP